jgi:hypothetical protein
MACVLRIGYDVHKDLLSFVYFCFFFVWQCKGRAEWCFGG